MSLFDQIDLEPSFINYLAGDDEIVCWASPPSSDMVGVPEPRELAKQACGDYAIELADGRLYLHARHRMKDYGFCSRQITVFRSREAALAAIQKCDLAGAPILIDAAFVERFGDDSDSYAQHVAL